MDFDDQTLLVQRSAVHGRVADTGNLTVGRYQHSVTLLNDEKVLLAGGQGASGQGSAGASAELYNPVTGTFTATGSLNTGRYYPTATLLNNGTILIAGGADSASTPLASTELYDPATGAFTVTGSLNNARQLRTAILLNNGMVLVAGGFGPSNHFMTSAELY